MEFQTEQEEDLYTALKGVLQNHIATHRLSYYQTLGACVPVLGYVMYIMQDGWEDPMALIVQTVDEIHQRTQTRLSYTSPPLRSFADYTSSPASSSPYEELGTALTMLLTTSGIEYDMAVDATWRVALSLLADVLAMPVHDAAQTSEEMDEYIASLQAQLLAVMGMWAEEQE